MLASAAKYTENERNKTQIKETKLNFVLIQNGKILLIFSSLQAKLLLFQEYRALFVTERYLFFSLIERYLIFFAVVRKKLAFFKLNGCSNNFTMQQSRKKSLLR